MFPNVTECEVVVWGVVDVVLGIIVELVKNLDNDDNPLWKFLWFLYWIDSISLDWISGLASYTDGIKIRYLIRLKVTNLQNVSIFLKFDVLLLTTVSFNLIQKYLLTSDFIFCKQRTNNKRAGKILRIIKPYHYKINKC